MIHRLLIAVLFFLGVVAPAATLPTSSARDLIAAGRIDDAVTSLHTRVGSNPQDAEAYHLLSRAFLVVQRWDDAISNGERAINIQPNSSDYHMWLGRAYGEKAGASNFLSAAGWAKKARDQFEQAVRLNGSNLPARSDLAEFYSSAPGFLGGGKDKARAQADQVSAIDPATSHAIRAMVAEKEKNFDVAEQEYKAAVQSSKSPAKHWIDLASFYRRRARWAEMDQAVNASLKAPNRPATILCDAAEVLQEAGRNRPMAAQLVEEYLNSKNPSDEYPVFAAHYLLGSVLEKSGDKAGAAQQYRSSLDLAHGFEKAQTALKRVQ